MKARIIALVGIVLLVASVNESKAYLPGTHEIHKPLPNRTQIKDSIVTHSKGSIKSVKTNKTKVQHIQKTQKH